MTDRERLIEILSKNIHMNEGETEVVAIANHLLDNGVILPPCKVGDTVYRIDDKKVFDWWEVIKLEIFEDETWFVDDSDNCFTTEEIGKIVFLTREAAEKALAERSATNATH